MDTRKTVKEGIRKALGGEGSGNYGHEGRPGEVGGSGPGGGISGKPAKSMMQGLMENGGFSYQPVTGKTPTTGYMVSPYKGREKVIPVNGVKRSDIVKYVLANMDVLKNEDHHVGGWVDSGKAYFDVSVRHEDQAKALTSAKEHSQLAIYDVKNGTSIYTQKGGN